MNRAYSVFESTAPRIVADLMRDFRLTLEQACGIVGNLGHESTGLTAFQEASPTVAGSRGGWGWAQWTGPRRRRFESFADRSKLGRKSYEANYGFMKLELSGAYAGSVRSIRACQSLRDATIDFERTYESAGVKHYESRLKWAQRAYAACKAASAKPAAPVPAPVPVPPVSKPGASPPVAKPVPAPKTGPIVVGGGGAAVTAAWSYSTVLGIAATVVVVAVAAYVGWRVYQNKKKSTP